MTTTVPGPGDRQAAPVETVSEAVQRQRVLMQAKASRSLPVVDGTFFAALGFLLVPQVPLSAHLVWCLCILMIDSARSTLGFRVIREIDTIPVRKVTLTMAILDCLAGLTFGIGGAWMMARSSEASALFIVGTAFIVPATGLLVLRASRLSVTLLAMGATGPIVWAWLNRHPEHALILSALTLTFWALIFVASGHLAQIVRQTMSVSRERDQLIGRLELRHREANDAMARAREAAQMRTQVLGSASHDLRQPMHALSIYAGVLKASHAPEQLALIVSKVDEVINSLSGLLHRLLELSRLISNQVSLSSEPLALDELVRQTCQSHADKANTRNLAFRIHLDPIQVSGDASALERVIDNLTENAFKFTERGIISVTLRMAPDGEHARLCIEDTGIGISTGDLNHVFEEYFQVRNQSRNRRQGVGLGLAIVQRLCTLMNAVISVRSEGGQGSCFQVDFPLVMPDGNTELSKAGETGVPTPVSQPGKNTAAGADVAAQSIARDPASDERDWTERSFDNDLMHELVLSRAIALARGPFAPLAGMAGLAAFCMPYVPGGFLAFWTGLFALLLCAEALHGRHVRNSILDEVSLLWSDRVQCLFTFAIGLTLALGWAHASTSLPPQEYFLTGSIVLIFPLIGVTWVLSSRFSQMCFALPVMIIVAIKTMQAFSENAFFLAVALVAYFMTIYLAASDLESMMAQAVELRRARELLARDLARSNQAIREATEQTAREGHMRTLALASASHDLRQPLHALAMCNATLAMRQSPETLLKVIRNLDNIVRSLGSLLHRLLDLSRSETDGLLIEASDIDLRAILQDVFEQTRPTIESKGLSPRAELASFSVHADPVAVRRIVGNLMSNACKFTDTGSVTLASRVISAGGRQIGLIEVRDTGRGVPEAYRSRIFDEYFQIGVTALKPENGVGLGLAIVQRLCRLMNGEVSYAALPNGGSCFRVTLPLSTGTEAADEFEDIRSTSHDAGVKVLLIDDDESIADSTLMLLRIWGFDCMLAADGPQADACIARWGYPDLIIADLRLPGPEQGVQIAQRLSAGSKPCAVLVVTGETSGKAIEDALAGGYSVLQKPVEPEALRGHIHKALAAALVH